MDLRAIEMFKNARKPIVPNVKAGDDVLILTDTDHDPTVWQVVSAIVSEVGATPTITIFPPRPADYYDPPDLVCEAMKRADVNIFLTTPSLFHSPASHECMQSDIPIICMDGGMTPDMLTKGAVTADYAEVTRLKYKIGKLVFGTGKNVRLTSEQGTDLKCSVEGRVFVPEKIPDALIENPLKAYKRTGEGRPFPLYGSLFPGGEFNTPPVEGTGEGTIVIDTSMQTLGLLKDPIRLTIGGGRIVDIEGGYQADILRKHLETYGDEYSWYMPSELSVGCNPKARVTGVMSEDRTILGAIHVALGLNYDVGGKIKSKLHMDGVILRPTLSVDGEIKIDKGKILGL
jgi:leucyl aminopeptidase (aminopeptidase T)